MTSCVSDAESQAVAADALNLVHLQVADEDVLAGVKRRVVVVRTDDVEVRHFDVAHVPQPDRNDVDAVGAVTLVIFLGVALVLAFGIHRTDLAGAGDLDVFDAFALEQRQVRNVHVVRPVDAGDRPFVPVGRFILVIARVLRLPKDRAFGDVQFDVAFQQDVGRDIAFAVKRAVAVEHDPSAPLRGSVVDRRWWRRYRR